MVIISNISRVDRCAGHCAGDFLHGMMIVGNSRHDEVEWGNCRCLKKRCGVDLVCSRAGLFWRSATLPRLGRLCPESPQFRSTTTP
jgi:hypothetical protein